MRFPIYLDHAATTPVSPEVMAAMQPYFTQRYGNPATGYHLGVHAAHAVEDARAAVADCLNADPDEIVFTSGGTEADNLAVIGATLASHQVNPHVLISAIEHHAVLDTIRILTRLGCDVELVPVDADGAVEPNEVARRINARTVLVSIMAANNETGVVQPITPIGALCRERGVLFHVDAVQALGSTPIDVNRVQADLLSFSAHKLYGPKGAGGLYIRRGVSVEPLAVGGQQEKGRRAGTLNVPGAVGTGVAVQQACSMIEREAVRLIRLRYELIEGVLDAIPVARLTGSRTNRLPNNAHFCFPDVDAGALLVELEAQGIYASAGSACTTGQDAPSHVLRAMGVDDRYIRGAIRLTLGRETDLESVQYVVRSMAQSYRAVSRYKG